MKTFIYTFIISVFAGLWTSEVYANVPFFKSKPKTRTSCTVIRGKHTVSDQIEYRYGVVAGRNIATIKSTKGDSQDIILGLMAGVAAQAIWPKGLVLQPEILYSQKGCIFTGNPLRYDMDYLEIPVKVMYRLNIADVKPFAFVAPYGAYAIKLSERGERISDDIFSSKINKMDFGIGVGAGFDFWKIQLSFKYTWGIAPILDDVFTVRNKVLTFSAGIFF